MLRIREHVAMVHECVRQGHAHGAVERAVAATFWIADLQRLDASPEMLEAMREELRIETGS